MTCDRHDHFRHQPTPAPTTDNNTEPTPTPTPYTDDINPIGDTPSSPTRTRQSTSGLGWGYQFAPTRHTPASLSNPIPQSQKNRGESVFGTGMNRTESFYNPPSRPFPMLPTLKRMLGWDEICTGCTGPVPEIYTYPVHRKPLISLSLRVFVPGVLENND